MKKDERIYIRVSEKMKTALQKKAAQESRTVSNYIVHLLEKELGDDLKMTEKNYFYKICFMPVNDSQYRGQEPWGYNEPTEDMEIEAESFDSALSIAMDTIVENTIQNMEHSDWEIAKRDEETGEIIFYDKFNEEYFGYMCVKGFVKTIPVKDVSMENDRFSYAEYTEIYPDKKQLLAGLKEQDDSLRIELVHENK